MPAAGAQAPGRLAQSLISSGFVEAPVAVAHSGASMRTAWAYSESAR